MGTPRMVMINDEHEQRPIRNPYVMDRSIMPSVPSSTPLGSLHSTLPISATMSMNGTMAHAHMHDGMIHGMPITMMDPHNIAGSGSGHDMTAMAMAAAGQPSLASLTPPGACYGAAVALYDHYHPAMAQRLAQRRRDIVSTTSDTVGVHVYEHQFTKSPASTIFRSPLPSLGIDPSVLVPSPAAISSLAPQMHNNYNNNTYYEPLVEWYKEHMNDIVTLADNGSIISIPLSHIYHHCANQLMMPLARVLMICHQMLINSVAMNSNNNDATSSTTIPTPSAYERRSIISHAIYDHLLHNDALRTSLLSQLPRMSYVRRRQPGASLAANRVAAPVVPSVSSMSYGHPLSCTYRYIYPIVVYCKSVSYDPCCYIL
jgi:hypothetical protein